jgi:signal transduction histidine kinase
MRLLPQSLFGRLVAAVLAILIVALMASLALHVHERGELLMRASGMRAAQRVADIVKLLESVAPGERRRIARILSDPPLTVTLDGPAVLAADDEEELIAHSALFTAMLRRSIGEERALRARVSTGSAPAVQEESFAGPMPPGWKHGPGAPMYGRGPGTMHAQAVSLAAQVQLSDGSWVTVASRQPIQTASWPYRLLWSIAILLLAAVAAAWLAVRWAMRPIAVMTAAAEELGRNVNRPPLPETGPVELARAARAFNQMQSRLVEYLRSRTRLLAAMSHDLKTPITRLRLRSELLDDPALRSRYAQDLQELESMVGTTLDFLRGIDEQEPAHPFDVMAMLESLQSDLEETGARVCVEGHTERPYTGQRRALRRAIGNLIDNAVQYAGEAQVVVRESPTDLTVLVLDRGPGIAAGELEKVFEPFYRVEASRNRATGGTGLGLAIARQIARAHGGDVSLSNRPEGGLEARLRLPLTASTAGTAA